MPQYIRKNISESRYIAPTAIQMQALPVLMGVRTSDDLCSPTQRRHRAESC